MGSILHLHTVPPTGGDTLFASMYAAYDALSPRMKAYLDGLTATHDGEGFIAAATATAASTTPARPIRGPSTPSSARHPVTGRRLLFVNPTFTTRINELREPRATRSWAFSTSTRQARFQARFRWRPNSVAFWDNRCTQHLAFGTTTHRSARAFA